MLNKALDLQNIPLPVVDLTDPTLSGKTDAQILISKSLAVREFLKRPENLCFIVTNKKSLPCLWKKESVGLQKRLEALSQEGSIFFIYRKGCDWADYENNLNHIFMPEAFDPAVALERAKIEKARKKTERTEVFAALSALKIIGDTIEKMPTKVFEMGPSDFVDEEDLNPEYCLAGLIAALSSTERKIILSVLDIDRIPAFKEWKNTPQVKAMKILRGINWTVERAKPTKYFEAFWPDFSGTLDVIHRRDKDLYIAVKNVLQGHPSYLTELVSYLSSIQKQSAA